MQSSHQGTGRRRQGRWHLREPAAWLPALSSACWGMRGDTPLGGRQPSSAGEGPRAAGRRWARGPSADRPRHRDTDPAQGHGAGTGGAQPRQRVHRDTSSRRESTKGPFVSKHQCPILNWVGGGGGEGGRRGREPSLGIIHKPHTGPFIGPKTRPRGYAKIY